MASEEEIRKHFGKAAERIKAYVAERVVPLCPPEKRESLDRAMREADFDIYGEDDDLIVHVIGLKYRIPKDYEPPTGKPKSN